MTRRTVRRALVAATVTTLALAPLAACGRSDDGGSGGTAEAGSIAHEATGEIAYGCILVAEEILDVMQRDWMRGEDVLPVVRTTSKIHVVEEARHMKFARHEIREHLRGSGRVRRQVAAEVIAGSARFIVSSMVNPGVYEAAGLDREQALAQARANTHHHNLMRMSCVHLMDFLSSAGLLTRPAMRHYRAVHML